MRRDGWKCSQTYCWRQLDRLGRWRLCWSGLCWRVWYYGQWGHLVRHPVAHFPGLGPGVRRQASKHKSKKTKHQGSNKPTTFAQTCILSSHRSSAPLAKQKIHRACQLRHIHASLKPPSQGPLSLTAALSSSHMPRAPSNGSVQQPIDTLHSLCSNGSPPQLLHVMHASPHTNHAYLHFTGGCLSCGQRYQDIPVEGHPGGGQPWPPHSAAGGCSETQGCRDGLSDSDPGYMVRRLRIPLNDKLANKLSRTSGCSGMGTKLQLWHPEYIAIHALSICACLRLCLPSAGGFKWADLRLYHCNYNLPPHCPAHYEAHYTVVIMIPSIPQSSMRNPKQEV